MLCSSYSAMAYVRNCLVCGCILQFLLLWTFWNEGIDKRDEKRELNVATEFKKDNSMDSRDHKTLQWKKETFEESNCIRKDNVVFIKPYYSGE